MKPGAGHGRRWAWGLVLCLALGLAGCAPRIYEPPPLPPPPPAPAPPPAVSRPVFYVNANRLNLRACPGMDCPKISVLERNEEVEKVGDTEDWAQVRVRRDGTLGWVNARYLSSQPVPTAPEAPPPAPPPTVAPPPLPEAPPPAKPPAAEKPKPVKPAEPGAPPAKKKVEEPKPAKPPKPEAREPASPKTKPPAEKPARPGEKPAPPGEKPAPEPAPEPGKRIRIM